MDAEIELLNKIVTAIEESKIDKEFDIPRVLEFLVDRYDFSGKMGRQRTLERIVYQLNKIDKQGVEEKV